MFFIIYIYIFFFFLGLNGFNFFLPASQATGAMGLSQNNLQQVNVPYVMVPSTALAGLPFLCSSTLANQISTVSSGSAISPGSMNYSLPGVPSSHIMFGASPVVSPQQCETSLEPTPALSPVCASPVPEKLASSTAADSPVCVVQPVPIKQNQVRNPLFDYRRKLSYYMHYIGK